LSKIILILTILSFNIELTRAQLVDIDGNVYNTERIGVQNIRHGSSSDSFLLWTTSNLNVSKFKTGEAIIEAKSSAEWEDALNKGIPAWCYVDNDSSTGKRLGKLYNYYAVTSLKELAPDGWHIASDFEWAMVYKYYNFNNLNEDEKILMDSSWNSNLSWGYGTNKTRFSALPSGHRYSSGFEKFGAYYWGDISLDRKNGSFHSILGDNYICEFGCEITYRFGFSVRCVKDY